MGWLKAFTGLAVADEVASRPYAPTPEVGISSPWATSQLEAITWAGLLDANVFPVSRPEALSVPAVARARMMIAGTIARIPLVTLVRDVADDPQPSWCQRTDGLSSPFTRMLWTVDDLYFYGDSLWIGTRGADRFPLGLERVPYGAWSVDGDRNIVIPAELASRLAPYCLVYIPGPHEGILSFGQRSIRAASIMDAAALDTARHPFRVELHQTSDAPMTDGDIDALIAKARSAMYENGGVLWTNQAVEARIHTFDPGALLIDGRNQAAVDVARVSGLPASLIDANTAGSSLTYETSTGRNREFLDYCLSTYMAAVTSRLSMDDVVPAGHRTAFDTSDFTGETPATTGPITDD